MFFPYEGDGQQEEPEGGQGLEEKVGQGAHGVVAGDKWPRMIKLTTLRDYGIAARPRKLVDKKLLN